MIRRMLQHELVQKKDACLETDGERFVVQQSDILRKPRFDTKDRHTQR
jgi:hypothetical protein